MTEPIETKPPFKMSPQVLLVILITLMALFLPLLAFSLGAAKYLKGRKAAQAEERQISPQMEAGLRNALETAADKQLKLPETSSPALVIAAPNLKTAKLRLNELAKGLYDAVILPGTTDKEAGIYLRQKYLPEMLRRIQSGEEKGISLAKMPTSTAPLDPDSWINVQVTFQLPTSSTPSTKK